MKRSHSILISLTALCSLAVSSHAQVLVSDTWLDGTRTDPASTTYSENGNDGDLDGNFESAWYRGGAGTLDPVGLGGPLRGDLGAGGGSSGSWTTYFTAGAAPITLANPGDSLKITWRFTLTGTAAQNASQNFRLAVVNTPSAALLAADGSPGNSTYSGYGMFMNMGTTLGHASPFQLVERTAPGTSSALLSAAASWTAITSDGVNGNNGYADATPYTYVMQLTLNGSGGVNIDSSITGGTLNGSGTMSISTTDTTPNSTSFNTFSLRPASATGAAQIFDTSELTVELIPEPSTLALAGLGVVALAVLRFRRRSN